MKTNKQRVMKPKESGNTNTSNYNVSVMSIKNYITVLEYPLLTEVKSSIT